MCYYYTIEYRNQRGNWQAHPRLFTEAEKKKARKKFEKIKKKKALNGDAAIFEKAYAE